MRLRKKKSPIEQAVGYVESVVDSVRPQVEAAARTATDEARTLLADAQSKAGPALADARQRATPYLQDARERAVELGTGAYEKAGPALSDARTKAAPLAAAGAAYASAKADELGDVAGSRLAELRGEPPKKKGSKLRTTIVVLGVGGLAYVVAKRLQGGSDSSTWQSSYVPSPPPPAPAAPSGPMGGAATAAGAESDDTAGSSPDEALADESNGKHAATTPDQPAEVVDLDEKKDS